MNKKIVYRLIDGRNPKELSDNISEYLAKDWVLYGSPTVTTLGEDWGFFQAVMSEENK